MSSPGNTSGLSGCSPSPNVFNSSGSSASPSTPQQLANMSGGLMGESPPPQLMDSTLSSNSSPYQPNQSQQCCSPNESGLGGMAPPSLASSPANSNNSPVNVSGGSAGGTSGVNRVLFPPSPAGSPQNQYMYSPQAQQQQQSPQNLSCSRTPQRMSPASTCCDTSGSPESLNISIPNASAVLAEMSNLTDTSYVSPPQQRTPLPSPFNRQATPTPPPAPRPQPAAPRYYAPGEIPRAPPLPPWTYNVQEESYGPLNRNITLEGTFDSGTAPEYRFFEEPNFARIRDMMAQLPARRREGPGAIILEDEFGEAAHPAWEGFDQMWMEPGHIGFPLMSPQERCATPPPPENAYYAQSTPVRHAPDRYRQPAWRHVNASPIFPPTPPGPQNYSGYSFLNESGLVDGANVSDWMDPLRGNRPNLSQEIPLTYSPPARPDVFPPEYIMETPPPGAPNPYRQQSPDIRLASMFRTPPTSPNVNIAPLFRTPPVSPDVNVAPLFRTPSPQRPATAPGSACGRVPTSPGYLARQAAFKGPYSPPPPPSGGGEMISPRQVTEQTPPGLMCSPVLAQGKGSPIPMKEEDYSYVRGKVTPSPIKEGDYSYVQGKVSPSPIRDGDYSYVQGKVSPSTIRDGGYTSGDNTMMSGANASTTQADFSLNVTSPGTSGSSGQADSTLNTTTDTSGSSGGCADASGASSGTVGSPVAQQTNSLNTSGGSTEASGSMNASALANSQASTLPTQSPQGRAGLMVGAGGGPPPGPGDSSSSSDSRTYTLSGVPGGPSGGGGSGRGGASGLPFGSQAGAGGSGGSWRPAEGMIPGSYNAASPARSLGQAGGGGGSWRPAAGAIPDSFNAGPQAGRSPVPQGALVPSPVRPRQGTALQNRSSTGAPRRAQVPSAIDILSGCLEQALRRLLAGHMVPVVNELIQTGMWPWRFCNCPQNQNRISAIGSPMAQSTPRGARTNAGLGGASREGLSFLEGLTNPGVFPPSALQEQQGLSRPISIGEPTARGGFSYMDQLGGPGQPIFLGSSARGGGGGGENPGAGGGSPFGPGAAGGSMGGWRPAAGMIPGSYNAGSSGTGSGMVPQNACQRPQSRSPQMVCPVQRPATPGQSDGQGRSPEVPRGGPASQVGGSPQQMNSCRRGSGSQRRMQQGTDVSGWSSFNSTIRDPANASNPDFNGDSYF